MNDERQQKPSCSSFERLYHCPGSYMAERQAPTVEQVSPDAETGTLIHDAIARDEIENLSEENRDVAHECVRLRKEIVREFGGDPSSGQYFVEREARIWWRLGMFSGQCDHVVIDGERALIIDYKTGYAGAPPAERNLQLAGYALLMQYHYGVTEVHVAIVQPRAFPRKSVSVYGIKELQAAEQAVTAMLHDAMTEGADRKSGHWCQYCKAKATCPEATGILTRLESIAKTGKLPAMTNEELSGLLDRAAIAIKIAKTIQDEARQRLIEGQEILNYKLKPGIIRKTIIDPEQVFANAVTATGISQDQFMRAVSITSKGLKSALKETGLKGKDLEAVYAQIIQGHTTETETQPSITRIK